MSIILWCLWFGTRDPVRRWHNQKILVAVTIGSILASAIVGGALAATQTTSSEPDSKSQEAAGETSQQKKTPKEYEEEMEDFVPSEKVPADSAISFPVDI